MYLSKLYQEAERKKITNPSAAQAQLEQMEAEQKMIYGNMVVTMDNVNHILRQRVLLCIALRGAQDEESKERLREMIDQMTEMVKKTLIV